MADDVPSPDTKPSPRRGPKTPIGDDALETLAVLAEGFVLLSDNLGTRSSPPRLLSLKTLVAQGTESFPFNLTSAVLTSLATRHFVRLVKANAVEARLGEVGAALGKKGPHRMEDGDHYLAWYENPWVITTEGRETLQAMLPRLERIRAGREAREAAPPRFLVTRRLRVAYGPKEPDFAVAGLYRITRETDNRFYVEHLREEDGVPSRDLSGLHDRAVEGSRAVLYVDKANVAAVDVTPGRFLAMRKAMEGYDESMAAASEQAEAELEPIRLRHEQRRVQIAARLADEMREISEAAQPPDAGPKC